MDSGTLIPFPSRRRRSAMRHLGELLLAMLLLAVALLPQRVRGAEGESAPRSKKAPATATMPAPEKKKGFSLFGAFERKETRRATPVTPAPTQTRTTRRMLPSGEMVTVSPGSATAGHASAKRSRTSTSHPASTSAPSSDASAQHRRSAAPAPEKKRAASTATASAAEKPEPAGASAATAASSVDELRIAVYGDSMANGLGWALEQVTARRAGVRVINRGKSSSGLARPDFYDWPASFRGFLATDKPDVAVIFLGLNDNQTIWNDGKFTFNFGTTGWEELYAQRVRDMIAIARAHNVRLIWVGLPQVNPPVYSKKVVLMNGIFSQATGSTGSGFIPTWDFSAPAGAYTAYLPDDSGTMKLARTSDGSHFTMRGNYMLGRYVLQQLDRLVPELASRASATAAAK